MYDEVLTRNRKSWDTMADTWFGTTALPVYGCLAPTETELKLFPDLDGKKEKYWILAAAVDTL